MDRGNGPAILYGRGRRPNPDINGAAATGSLTGANDIYVGIGTKGNTGSTGWDGAVGDVIAYREPLGTTRLTLVRNYLSAKYDIDLNTSNGAVDVYAGDTGSKRQLRPWRIRHRAHVGQRLPLGCTGRWSPLRSYHRVRRWGLSPRRPCDTVQ